MSDSSRRRYEILLPRRFNDGRAVPEELGVETLMELRQHFGAVSCETQTIHGMWENEGQVYQDDLVRLFIDVPDLSETRQFFLKFKERIKVRFEQIDIWMTSYPVDVL